MMGKQASQEAQLFYYDISLGEFPGSDLSLFLQGRNTFACVIALIFGYCTVSFRTWYEKMVMPAAEEESAVEAKKSA